MQEGDEGDQDSGCIEECIFRIETNLKVSNPLELYRNTYSTFILLYTSYMTIHAMLVVFTN